MNIPWKLIFASLGVLLMMRVGGLINNFFAGVGLVAFALAIVLLQLLPAWRRTTTLVFVVWVGVAFPIPTINLAFRASWPILGAALTRRSVDSEIRSAEWADPAGLRGRVGWARYCLALDERQGDWISQELGRVKVEPDATTRMPRPQQAEIQRLRAAQAQIEQDRLECRGLILKPQTNLSGLKPAGDWRESVADWFTASPRLTVWALVALGIAAVAVGVVLRQFSVLKGAVLVALIVAAGFAGESWNKTWTFFCAPKPKIVCMPDYDRPMRQAIELHGPKSAAYVKLPHNRRIVAQYAINRDEVEGELNIDFDDGSRDTWSPGEPRQEGHWQGKLPERLYGRGVAEVTVFEKTCAAVR